MRLNLLFSTLLLVAVTASPAQLASPFSNSVFPAQTFTATGQTGTPIQLNGLTSPSTVGSAFASGTITLAGSSLTTVTFAVQGSSDNGGSYYPLPACAPTSPGCTTTTVTATGNGIYQVNLAGITHVRFVTSGTFTATNISLTLTASPNASVARGSGGGGSGIVGSGTNGQFATYPADGTTVSGHTLSASDINGLGSITNSTSGNAATATALAATPTQCSTGQAPTGILANGNATGCASSGGGGLSVQTAGTPNASQTTLNFQASTKNASGLIATPVNASGGNVQVEISGGISTCPLQTSVNICLTLAPYYASPDGAVTTTTTATVSSGATSIPVTSTSTFAANQGVNVAGAGAFASTTMTTTSGSPAITVASATNILEGSVITGTGVPAGTVVNSVAGTTVNMNANATASGSGVAVTFKSNYIGTITAVGGGALTVTPATVTSISSGAVVKHDNTAAFSLFFSNVDAGATHSGIGYLPCTSSSGATALYPVNGVIQNTSTANTVLQVPSVTNYGSQLDVIGLEGFCEPASAGAGMGPFLSTDYMAAANILAGYDAATGGGYPPFTNVELYLKNIGFLTPTNSGMCEVNATNILSFKQSHMLYRTAGASLPTNPNGCGYKSSSILNQPMSEADDIITAGFATGAQKTEHNFTAHEEAVNSINGIVFDTGSNTFQPPTYTGNAQSVGYVWAGFNTCSISAGANDTAISILAVSSEMATSHDICDPSNHLRGHIFAENPYSPHTINIQGGANLTVFDLWQNKYITPLIIDKNLGVGTSSPNSWLGISAVTGSNLQVSTSATSGSARILLGTSATGQVADIWQWNANATANSRAWITRVDTSGFWNLMQVHDDATSPVTAMQIAPVTGAVTIGSTSQTTAHALTAIVNSTSTVALNAKNTFVSSGNVAIPIAQMVATGMTPGATGPTPEVLMGYSPTTVYGTAVWSYAPNGSTPSSSSYTWLGVGGASTAEPGVAVNGSGGICTKFVINSGTCAGTGVLAPALVSSGTTFTVSGCSATTPVGGAAAGQFASGTTGTCTATITIAGGTGYTAPHGWRCSADDVTTATHMPQSATSTTTCTVAGTTTSGDTIVFSAIGY